MEIAAKTNRQLRCDIRARSCGGCQWSRQRWLKKSQSFVPRDPHLASQRLQVWAREAAEWRQKRPQEVAPLLPLEKPQRSRTPREERLAADPRAIGVGFARPISRPARSTGF